MIKVFSVYWLVLYFPERRVCRKPHQYEYPVLPDRHLHQKRYTAPAPGFTGVDVKWSLLIVVAPWRSPGWKVDDTAFFEVKYFHAGTPDRLGISLEYTDRFMMLAIRSKMVDWVRDTDWIFQVFMSTLGNVWLPNSIDQRPATVIPDQIRQATRPGNPQSNIQ